MPIQTRENYWILETAQSGYAFGITPRGFLAHTYWGPRLPFSTDYPEPVEPPPWASFSDSDHQTAEEYPAYAGAKYVEPCLKATFADGVRDVVLKVAGAAVVAGPQPELLVTLRDSYYPLTVVLHYRLHETYDLIERWAEITNQGDTPVTLERVWSALWHLPQGGAYRLAHCSGRHLDEWRLNREPLQPGVKVKESRRITTSHHAKPWFAVDRGTADEGQGEVWFGALAWSGNWKLAAEVTDFGSTRIGLGVNDWDFAWRLQPGETFTTPPSLAGYTTGGFGAASRTCHDYVRDQLLPHGKQLHPVLYNSWEAVFFDVSEESQIAVAELAAQMGVELFVMDDGWFHRRVIDNAGLGDWWPDATKFPQGMKPLIDRVNTLGMDFGLWLEPEMVNPDSELYRAHPDWVIHFPNRARTELRSQLILNLGRTDVQEYLIDVLDRLLSEHNITFIKWDMNRNVSEPGWPDAPGDARGALGALRPGALPRLGHAGGAPPGHPLAELFGRRRARRPGHVAAGRPVLGERQHRSGGATGHPGGLLPTHARHHHGEPGDRHGLYPAPLEFRFHVSMMGVLGISSDLLKWTAAERELGAKLIAQYKEIRPLVQLGDQYRLLPAQGSTFTAVQYMSKDRQAGVFFAFRTHIPEPVSLAPLYLRGLEPAARYTVEGFPGVRSGQAWMSTGLQLELKDLQSTLRWIRRVG